MDFRVIVALLICLALASCSSEPDRLAAIDTVHVEPEVRPAADAYTVMRIGDGTTGQVRAEFAALGFSDADEAENVRHSATAETLGGDRKIYRYQAVTSQGAFGLLGSYRSDCHMSEFGGGCSMIAEPEQTGITILWPTGNDGSWDLRHTRIATDEPWQNWLFFPENAATVVVEYASGVRHGSDIVDGLAWLEPPVDDEFDPEEAVSITFNDAQGEELLFIDEREVRDKRNP